MANSKKGHFGITQDQCNMVPIVQRGNVTYRYTIAPTMAIVQYWDLYTLIANGETDHREILQMLVNSISLHHWTSSLRWFWRTPIVTWELSAILLNPWCFFLMGYHAVDEYKWIQNICHSGLINSFIAPLQQSLNGMYTGFTVSLCPSFCPFVGGILSVLYLEICSLDPFYIGTSYQANYESVSTVKFVAKF